MHSAELRMLQILIKNWDFKFEDNAMDQITFKTSSLVTELKNNSPILTGTESFLIPYGYL